SRPHHSDGRRAAREQLPALAGRVRGDAGHRHAVARLRRFRPEVCAGRLRLPHPALRRAPRGRDRPGSRPFPRAGWSRRRRGWGRVALTTRNPSLMGGWKPSPLMVRILSGAVILAAVIGLIFAGRYGVYALVLILGGLALWEFNGLSEGVGSRAPAWLLFP